MEAVLHEVQIDGTSLTANAKEYGVPQPSLQFKIQNPSHKNTRGPPPVLSH
jgi:hypothetical protein